MSVLVESVCMHAHSWAKVAASRARMKANFFAEFRVKTYYQQVKYRKETEIIYKQSFSGILFSS